MAASQAPKRFFMRSLLMAALASGAAADCAAATTAVGTDCGSPPSDDAICQPGACNTAVAAYIQQCQGTGAAVTTMEQKYARCPCVLARSNWTAACASADLTSTCYGPCRAAFDVYAAQCSSDAQHGGEVTNYATQTLSQCPTTTVTSTVTTTITTTSTATSTASTSTLTCQGALMARGGVCPTDPSQGMQAMCPPGACNTATSVFIEACRGDSEIQVGSLEQMFAQCPCYNANFAWTTECGNATQFSFCHGSCRAAFTDFAAKCRNNTAFASQVTSEEARVMQCGTTTVTATTVTATTSTATTITTTVPVVVEETIVQGSMNMTVSDPQAFIQDPNVTLGITRALANVTGVPEQYINVTLRVEGRRLLEADSRARFLSTGTVVVEHTITIPRDAPAAVASITGDNIKSSVTSVTPVQMTTLVQNEVQAVTGAGVVASYSLTVTDIATPTVTEVTSAPTPVPTPAAPTATSTSGAPTPAPESGGATTTTASQSGGSAMVSSAVRRLGGAASGLLPVAAAVLAMAARGAQ